MTLKQLSVSSFQENLLPKRKYVPVAIKLGTQSRWSSLIINMIWQATFRSGSSPPFYRIAILINFLSYKNVTESFFKMKTFKSLTDVMEPFLNVKNFKSPKKMMESFFGIKSFETVMVSFYSIKNFSKAMVEFSLSFKSFNSR